MGRESGDGYLITRIQMDMDRAKIVDNKSVDNEAVKGTKCESYKNVWVNSNCQKLTANKWLLAEGQNVEVEFIKKKKNMLSWKFSTKMRLF